MNDHRIPLDHMQHVVDELDGDLLVALGIDAQHPQSRAVVDGGELVEPFASSSRDGFEKLDVDLDPVAGQLLLITLPAPVVPLMALGGRQSAMPRRCRMSQTPEVLMVSRGIA